MIKFCVFFMKISLILFPETTKIANVYIYIQTSLHYFSMKECANNDFIKKTNKTSNWYSQSAGIRNKALAFHHVKMTLETTVKTFNQQ